MLRCLFLAPSNIKQQFIRNCIVNFDQHTFTNKERYFTARINTIFQRWLHPKVMDRLGTDGWTDRRRQPMGGKAPRGRAIQKRCQSACQCQSEMVPTVLMLNRRQHVADDEKQYDMTTLLSLSGRWEIGYNSPVFPVTPPSDPLTQSPQAILANLLQLNAYHK